MHTTINRRALVTGAAAAPIEAAGGGDRDGEVHVRTGRRTAHQKERHGARSPLSWPEAIAESVRLPERQECPIS